MFVQSIILAQTYVSVERGEGDNWIAQKTRVTDLSICNAEACLFAFYSTRQEKISAAMGAATLPPVPPASTSTQTA